MAQHTKILTDSLQAIAQRCVPGMIGQVPEAVQAALTLGVMGVVEGGVLEDVELIDLIGHLTGLASVGLLPA